jgi:methionine synthase / methylenetetrahydrofolate reductase(NADPH)
MSLKKDLKEKSFLITTEINPPKSTDASKALSNASKVKGLVSAINITDNSGANMKMCPMALSYLIQSELGIETIWQMTCRDRNRLALQSDLLGGIALGLKNLLPLRGDDPKTGDHPESRFAYDFETEELLLAISKLKSGEDFNSHKVEIETKAFDYCVGSAAHPGLADLEKQKETMLKREDLGVEFFQTQICFDLEQIYKFLDSIGEDLASKTLIGITPIKTLGQAQFINRNIWGVNIPEKILSRIGSSEHVQKEGLKISKELVDEIKKTPFKGIHLMAIGQENVLDEIINAIS